MASVNGVSIKSLKTFKDHEGMNIYQGNVYLDGKKLGFWSQDYNGGICDNFDFDEHLLDDAVEKYKASDMVEDKYREFTSAETLLSGVVEVMLTEKQFKQYQKKGYDGMIEVTDNYHFFSGACKLPTLVDANERILEVFKNQIEEWKGQRFKNEPIRVNTYTSLKDFEITTDNKELELEEEMEM